jgi:hypothetical protein
MDGNHLINTRVTYYEKGTLRIEVEEPPPAFTIGFSCRLLVLSAPTPCEFMGRVTKEGLRFIIALYQGKEKESREAVRYKVNFRAQIENLVCDGRAFALHTPLEVQLINISKSGMRFSAPKNALRAEDRFQLRMKVGEGDKLLIADVVHEGKKDAVLTEYGCKFLVGSEVIP